MAKMRNDCAVWGDRTLRERTEHFSLLNFKLWWKKNCSQPQYFTFTKKKRERNIKQQYKQTWKRFSTHTHTHTTTICSTVKQPERKKVRFDETECNPASTHTHTHTHTRGMLLFLSKGFGIPREQKTTLSCHSTKTLVAWSRARREACWRDFVNKKSNTSRHTHTQTHMQTHTHTAAFHSHKLWSWWRKCLRGSPPPCLQVKLWQRPNLSVLLSHLLIRNQQRSLVAVFSAKWRKRHICYIMCAYFEFFC